MKTGLVYILVLVQVYIITAPCFCQHNHDLTVIKTSGDKIIADKGINNNIQNKQQYFIIRNNQIIGVAQVTMVKPEICGLIQTSGKPAVIGDKLTIVKSKPMKFKRDSNIGFFTGILLSIGGIALTIIGIDHKKNIDLGDYTIAKKTDPDETMIAAGIAVTLLGLISLSIYDKNNAM